MRCAISVSAYSSTSDSGIVRRVEREEDDRRVGRIDLAGSSAASVISTGSCGAAAEVSADCTSSAAASMSRSRSNCSVIWVMPCRSTTLIELTPAMVENCLSSGVATEAAMVSGEAPGKWPVTTMVGKSTFGNRGDREQAITEKTEDDEGQHQQRRHHRTTDA